MRLSVDQFPFLKEAELSAPTYHSSKRLDPCLLLYSLNRLTSPFIQTTLRENFTEIQKWSKADVQGL